MSSESCWSPHRAAIFSGRPTNVLESESCLKHAGRFISSPLKHLTDFFVFFKFFDGHQPFCGATTANIKEKVAFVFAFTRSEHSLRLTRILFLPSATYLRQGNVFTPVCHSVHRGVYPSMHWDRHPPGRHIPACTGADNPPGKHTPRADTHPSGRHHHPWADTPTGNGYCCGWYASYWNAFLF